MAIRIEIDGDRIRLDSTRKLKALHKTIPGANFARTNGSHWTLPLKISSLVLLRKKFKDELEFGPALREWGWAQKRKLKEMRDIARQDVVLDLPVLRERYPKLYLAVTQGRKYQSIGVKFIKTGLGVIIADTVGLGKSAQTIGGILDADVPGRHLIICPKTSCESVWVPEILHWTDMELPVWSVPEGRDARNEVLKQLSRPLEVKHEWWVMHPQMLNTRAYWECRKKIDGEVCGTLTQIKSRTKKLVCEHEGARTVIRTEHDFPQIFKSVWSSVVVDENHKSLLRRGSVPSQIRRGMESLKVREGGIRIAQSATPWASKPYHLWSVLNWLFPDYETSFWSWVETFYEVEDGFGDAREIGDLREDRKKLLSTTLDAVMLRRTREEVRADLPPRMYVGTPFHYGDDNSPVATWLPMEGEQLRAYREMAEDGEANIEGGQVSAIGALAELTRLKQFASSYGMWTDRGFKPCMPSNKFDKMLEILETLGIPHEPQSKVVVVSEHTELINLFSAELLKRGIGNIVLTGNTSPKNRALYLKQFNKPIRAGDPCVLFLNTKVGGASITIDSADDMIIIDESFEFDDQDQVEGRIDNRRPEEKIVQRRYHYLKSLDTVDVGIALANAEDASVTRDLLDGRRGVTFARRVFELAATATRKSGVQ